MLSRHHFSDDATMYTEEQVIQWLENVGLDEYSTRFREHRVNGKDLSIATPKTLLAMGFRQEPDRQRIMSEIQDLYFARGTRPVILLRLLL